MSTSLPRLLVGLGNPGPKYTQTRHNAGFWFCERLAERLGARFTFESRFGGFVAKSREDDITLLMPQTFMNRSGQSVGALARFFRIDPAEILVVHDELDIPPGQLRLKFGGGHGGHNGLKDIAAHCGTRDFWRLRIGIGHPGDRSEVINFVLKSPGRDEAIAIDTAIDRAIETWPLLSRGNWNAAATRINARPPKSASNSEDPA